MSNDKQKEYLRNRIAWIDEHEKMFELSHCMKLEREACKEQLKALEEKEKSTND